MKKNRTIPEKITGRFQRFYSRHLRVLDVVYRQQKTPVIVYTMGKVGSMSINASIPKDTPHFHIHTMIPERISLRKKEENTVQHYHGEQIRDYITLRDYPAKYVIMIRNPIDRNLSTFFQRFKYYMGVKFEKSQHSLEDLMKTFHSRFEHERPIRWFDDEIKRFLGVDVYQYEFPREKGYQRIQVKNADILIMKLEIPDSVKEQGFAEFLDYPEFRLNNINVGDEKAYSETYNAFKKQIVLSEDYISQMLDSPYMRHFYTPEEIEKSRQKWLARLQEAGTEA